MTDEDEARFSEAAEAHDALIDGYDSYDDMPDEVAAKAQALSDEIDAISAKRSAYDPAIIARGGVFVSLSADGNVRIERGYVRAEDKPQPEAEDDSDGIESEDGEAVENEDADEEDVEDADAAKPIPDTFIRDLTAHRTMALRLALGEQPGMAMIALTHALVLNLFYRGFGKSCLEITAKSEELCSHVEAIADSKPLSLSLIEILRDFPRVELAAVNQCSGNSRGFFQPRVPGGEWGHGAMGNAKWVGVRLRDVLDKAGVKSGALAVRFAGLDEPLVPTVDDFRKSLALDHARDGEVMIAFQMNGSAPPLLNGFPLRLIVPGWVSTYWSKMLSDIEVLDKPDNNFWMAKAYKLPDNRLANMKSGEKGVNMVPISTMVPRSWIANLADGGHVRSRGGDARAGHCAWRYGWRRAGRFLHRQWSDQAADQTWPR